MAIKLIRSKTYINNIRDFLPEKSQSKSTTSEKAYKIFDKILNSPNFIFDKSDEKIIDPIRTLITIRPGRTLFKHLLKADKPLTIVLDSKKVSGFSYSQTATTITLNDSKVHYYISVNSDGEKFFFPAPLFITLAHELVHALHYFEEGREFVIEKSKNKNILDPDLDNLEEQETTIGKEGEATLCENVFRFHFGYPLRINHRGILLNKGNTITASTCAMKGTLATLKELLLSNPSLLNYPQQCEDTDIWVTPLNASLAENQVEISDYLLQVGVDVDAKDDFFGTALHTAVITKQPDWVKVLLEKGATRDVKDPRGFTALELALLARAGEMVELLAPRPVALRGST